MDSGGQAAYSPVNGEVNVSLVERHLLGEIVLGAYNLTPDSRVTWMAFDVDSTDREKARELTLKIHELLVNVPHGIEFSGSKGYHVLVFLRNKVDADQVKNIGDTIREVVGGRRSGDPHIEVFPKQDKLTDSNPLGNLLKVPLGVHPVTGARSIFVDPAQGWENGPTVDPASILASKTTLQELGKALEEYERGEGVNPLDKIVRIMKPYWLPGQRHDLSLFLSGYLAQNGWDEVDAIEIIEKLQQEEGGDLNNQLACVRDTFQSFQDGKSVSGMQGLASLIPSKILRELAEATSKDDERASIASIDRIRLGRTAPHLKVRMATDAIIRFLRQEGEVLKDDKNQELYWLNRQDRNLYNFRDETWEIFMLNVFGINPEEGFGRQVLKAIYSNSHDIAKKAHTHSRSWWSGSELWINLGETTNYVIDGNGLNINANGNFGSRWGREVLNGDEGVIFRNRDSHLQLDLNSAWKSGVKEEDPWNYLVNDLNFGIGSSGVTPLQQREMIKAWFLSTFFPNVMPTRPLLTIVAAPGAGKTTAARRFLRVLEGPNSDVMGLLSDKPDSLRASLSSHKFVVLDNLEKTKSYWLTDTLNRISTGTHIELRRLHTTNETQIITPDCFVILTATALPFSEESLFSRLLPVELAPLLSPIPEYTMQTRITDNLEGIWMGIFKLLSSVVGELKRVKTAPAPTESRLADFSIFCARIRGLQINGSGDLDGEALISGLTMISNRQKALLWEASPLIQILDLWIKDDMASHG
jgi:hypothetical protein